MKRRELTPFGKAIKKALVDKEMTQVELAERLGMSPKYLNLIMIGDRSGEKYRNAISILLDLEEYEELTA